MRDRSISETRHVNTNDLLRATCTLFRWPALWPGRRTGEPANRKSWMRMPSLVLPTIAVLLSAGFITHCEAQAQTWIEDSFEDFTDGQLDASGQNVYVSKAGTVRTIHRFDLNGDGYIDLLFNSTHDDYAFIPSTLAEFSGDRKLRTDTLAVEGAISAAIADLNRDGFHDIVFCPSPNGIQRSRQFVRIIWGGEDDWPSHRSGGMLPIHGARALALADLNGDSWPDIVTLNHDAWIPGQPKGNIIRTYWGSEDGFLLSRYRDTGIPAAAALAAGDFDADGHSDIAVAASDGTVHVIWAMKDGGDSPVCDVSKMDLSEKGTACIAAADVDSDGHVDILIGGDTVSIVKGEEGRSWGTVEMVPGLKASHIAVGDVDDDGSSDLVLSHFVQVTAMGGEMTGGTGDANRCVTVLWGGDNGYDPSDVTRLDAPHNIASAIADFDGDGFKDIVCAVHQGKTTYVAESPVFFGAANRRFLRGKEGISSEGAYHVAVVPAVGDQLPRIVVSNSKGGTLREEIPVNLYWGGPDGFDPKRRLKIPFRSGYEATAADFNADGHVDLLLIDAMHGGQGAEDDPWHGANIFWGADGGFDLQRRRTILHEVGAGTSNTADLNRDGFLDIVIGFFERRDKKPTELVIYYGSEKGYVPAHRVAIPCDGRSNSPVIADYDRDGWLDIAVSSFLKDRLHVFWGGPEGFRETRQHGVDIPALIDLEAADLNADGWLDIVACSYHDKVNHHDDSGFSWSINQHNDTGVVLLWGGPRGFRNTNAQWLPGMTTLGPVVADFDADGFLDLFCPHYHAELRRELLPSYLYWGGRKGFHTRRRTNLINDSGADGLAADFDGDGLLDLAVVNHTVHGSHAAAMSKVFYNDGNRFLAPKKIERLPSPGAHWMWNEDMGHIYHRKWEQTYVSSVFEWTGAVTKGRLAFRGKIPGKSKLVFSVRSADTVENLKSARFRDVIDGLFHLAKKDRALQYRATFISDNGDRYPVLDRVVITLAK